MKQGAEPNNKAQRESEGLFRDLAENSPNMIFVFQDGKIKYANKACEVLGYTHEELLAPDFDFMRLIAPESCEKVTRIFRGHVEGREIPPQECNLLERDGERLHAIHATRLITYRGRPAVLGVVTDITERGRSEEAVRASEGLYRSLFEDSRDAILIVSLEGCLLDANQSWVQLFGYTKSETRNLCLKDLFVSGQKAWNVQNMLGASELIRDWGAKLRTKDGAELDCLLTAGPWRVRAGMDSGFQVIVRDVTDSKRLQQRAYLSQRLEAVGQLAGGVAHDFNNILMAIMSSCELLRSDLEPDHRGRAEIEEIKQAASRASDLTRQLLAFSRKQVLQPRVLDLSAVVRHTEKMLRRVIGENIELVTVLPEHLGSVKADPGQIEQVIMNLAVNARDAMPEGGRLIIETADVELDEEYARAHVAARPGPFVMVAISDTGQGMDEETQARIFEPFFSTKHMGKGTGLGLATVYGIVKQSGGFIWVYSEPKGGTTFKIYLPGVEAHAEVSSETSAVTATPRGVETVLVVEDEPAVRALVSKFLRKHGYTVFEASRPSEALKIAEEAGPIDLLLTDVVLPEINGRELAERLAALQPNLRVLYVSGYADQAITHQEILDPKSSFMQKPFAPETLARKVREVLDSAVDNGPAAGQGTDTHSDTDGAK